MNDYENEEENLLNGLIFTSKPSRQFLQKKDNKYLKVFL